MRLQILIRVLGKGLSYLSKDLKKGTRYALLIARGRVLQAEGTANEKVLRQEWSWSERSARAGRTVQPELSRMRDGRGGKVRSHRDGRHATVNMQLSWE